MLEQIHARVLELAKALEESVLRHNHLLGAFEEAKKIHELCLASKPAPSAENDIENQAPVEQ